MHYRIGRWVLCLVLIMVTAGALNLRPAQAQGPLRVELALTTVGQSAVEGATGEVIFDKAEGWIVFRLKLAKPFTLGGKFVYEGWIFDDSPLLNPDSSASPRDNQAGHAYNNKSIAGVLEAIPAWSTGGALTDKGDGLNFEGAMRWPSYNFGPFDTVAITLETDGNETPWDPRPGSALLAGKTKDAKPTDEQTDVAALHGPMPDMTAGQGVRLRPTGIAKKLSMGEATGRAILLIEGGAAIVEASGLTAPEGAVFEAYVVDGGMLGNFGPSHAHALDNALGPGGGNQHISDIADVVPFATSLGVMQADPSRPGTFTLQVHWTKYAFRVYNIVMITVETDGNKAPWDPRPGAPILVGAITPATDLSALVADPQE